MSKEDWIEIAFIFEERPGSDELESLFESLLANSDSDTNDLDIAAWDDTSDIHHYSGNAAEAAAACSEYLDSTIGIRFEGFKLQIGSGYSNGLLADIPHVTAREGIHPFTDSSEVSEDTILARRKRFVRTLARCAEVLDPKWGFGRRDGVAIADDQTIEKLVTMERPPLYEYNVLNSETAEAIGHKTIQNTPAWFTQELDTGGVFIAVREPPHRCGPKTEECLAVADHLGLDIAEPTRYR